MYVKGANERLPAMGWVVGTLAGHPGWPGVVGDLPGSHKPGCDAMHSRCPGAGVQGSSPRALGRGIAGELKANGHDHLTPVCRRGSPTSPAPLPGVTPTTTAPPAGEEPAAFPCPSARRGEGTSKPSRQAEGKAPRTAPAGRGLPRYRPPPSSRPAVRLAGRGEAAPHRLPRGRPAGAGIGAGPRAGGCQWWRGGGARCGQWPMAERGGAGTPGR